MLRRNFWFCALDDDAGHGVRDRIGVEHILVESDYPHADSSWPDTQAMLVRQLRDQGVPDDEARRITWRNASELFRHPVPDALPAVTDTIAALVARNARERPDGVAFVEVASGDDDDVARVRRALVADGRHARATAYAPGDRVALQLPDGPGVHAAMLGVREGRASSRSGIGARAGDARGRAPRRAQRRARRC